MNNLIVLMGMMSVSTLAQAQTGGSPNQTKESTTISAEIKMTVQFLGSAVDSMREGNHENRFDVTPDYAVSGRALRTQLRNQMQDFRTALLSLTDNDFGDNVMLYRKEVADKSTASETHRKQLESLYQTLLDQSTSTTSIYQADLKRLLNAEKAWIPERVELNQKKRKAPYSYSVIFANGDKLPLTLSFDYDLGEHPLTDYGYGENQLSSRLIQGYTQYPNLSIEPVHGSSGKGIYENYEQAYFSGVLRKAIQQAIISQIKTTIYNACPTSNLCKSNLYADYTNYYHQVKNMVNIELPFELGEGNAILIEPLSLENGTNAQSIPYNDLYAAFKQFDFNADLNH